MAEIKIIVGQQYDDYKTFIFGYNSIEIISDIEKHFFNHTLCSKCNIIELSAGYLYIISKLGDAGLLSKDFEPICCDCLYKIEKIGTAFCYECGGLLEMTMSDHSIGIYCSPCNHICYSKDF